MSKFLIIYSTTDGHTKKICQRIKNFLVDGNLVELLSLEDSKKINLSNYIIVSIFLKLPRKNKRGKSSKIYNRKHSERLCCLL